MDPARRDRISDIYSRALAQPLEDRDAFLRNECAGDESLREEVESLLEYGSAESFLETPASQIVATAPSARLPMVNRQLGHYTIVAPLGAGGMGEVYRARDTRLRRDVAIKILPSTVNADPERRARFAREARLLATVNHPHIAAIYGVEESDGLTALVLELVEGPTLAERLERGRLPVAQALTIARQIAEALDAAHEKGVVHRDLKPANIVLQGTTDVSPDGVRAKVLDFGLAKATTTALGADAAHSSSSLDRTADERILGTPAYMSPEQSRGSSVDKRTDIWAFGCVLFEMLSGRSPFESETASDTVARILEREPDWSALPAETPFHVRRLLERCLRKDPRKRLHDIADALIELEDAAVAPVDAPSDTRRRRITRERFAWITAVGMALALAAFAVVQSRSRPTLTGSLEFPIAPPEDWSFTATIPAPTFAVSPDGERLVVAASSDGPSTLWVRPIGTPAWRQLPGTEGATEPFWSPDSQTIGFFAGGRLRTIALVGGAPATICDVPPGQVSGAWSPDGMILFGGAGPLMRVREGGGDPSVVTTLAGDETAHRWPSFLPDGDHFLFLAQSEFLNELRVGSLSSGETTSLGPFESHAVYTSGYLLFVRGGQLFAQPFDPDSRRLAGDPMLVAEKTTVVIPWLRGQFSAAGTSRNRVLVYSSLGRPLTQLTWVGRTGKPMGTPAEPGHYMNVNLSPDNRYVAVSRFTEPPGAPWNVDIWIVDLAREGTASRLTTHRAREFDPAWSPDGKQVAFNSSRIRRGFSLFRRPFGTSGDDELVVAAEGTITAPDWSPDGRFLMYSATGEATQRDLWIVPLSGDRKPETFLATPFSEGSGSFSPDGRWVAYQSNESGRNEVYVRPFPASNAVFPISRDGGTEPRWKSDGGELFFLAPDGTLMSATISTTAGFHASVPQPLFNTGLASTPHNRPYAVANDGQQFLIPIPVDPPSQAPVTVVLNWPAVLSR